MLCEIDQSMECVANNSFIIDNFKQLVWLDEANAIKYNNMVFFIPA